VRADPAPTPAEEEAGLEGDVSEARHKCAKEAVLVLVGPADTVCACDNACCACCSGVMLMDNRLCLLDGPVEAAAAANAAVATASAASATAACACASDTFAR